MMRWMPSFAVWRPSVAEVVAETERLRLREWEDADEVRFYEVMNRPEVMEHLGHTNIQTTINTYGHLFPSVRVRIRSALEKAWSTATAENPAAHPRPKPTARRRVAGRATR